MTVQLLNEEGLRACRNPAAAPAAWEIVSTAASAFVALDDRYALEGVRLFVTPSSGDVAIESGETGAAGLAALLAAQKHPRLRDLLGLDAPSRVLLLTLLELADDPET